MPDDVMGTIEVKGLPEKRQGYRTSEFWTSIMSTAAGLGLVAYGVVQSNDTALIVGGALAGLVPGAYSLSRGLAKS